VVSGGARARLAPAPATTRENLHHPAPMVAREHRPWRSLEDGAHYEREQASWCMAEARSKVRVGRATGWGEEHGARSKRASGIESRARWENAAAASRVRHGVWTRIRDMEMSTNKKRQSCGTCHTCPSGGSHWR
jgi:hypothetical protein